MVSISAKGVNRQRRRSRSLLPMGSLETWVILVLFCLLAGYSVVSIYSFTTSGSGSNVSPGQPLIRKEDQEKVYRSLESAPSLHLENKLLKENEDFFDSKAFDVVEMLTCSTLLKNKTPGIKSGGYIYGGENGDIEEDNTTQTKRRLEEEQPIDYDDFEMDPGDTNGAYVTAAHLFCDAIATDTSDSFWKDKLKCRASTEDLLDLWSDARAEFTDPTQLTQALQLIVEQPIVLGDITYNVWAPLDDEGTQFMTQSLNDQILKKTRIARLDENLGEGRLFVDVGSGLGYTALSIAQLYPGTDIVSIEVTKQPLSILHAGVGSSSGTSQRANFVWRPTQTTSTRAWALDDPTTDQEDVEFNVRLWPWHKILAYAEIQTRTIDVLNLDCEGCEYNLLPALSEEEFFDDVRTVMGELHWSYIPTLKRPSSERASSTHGLLCQHEDFAHQAKECCAFPDAVVKSSLSGEVLAQEGNVMESVTVSDLIGDTLCPDFQEWAAEHSLFSVESDWAWLQVGTMKHQQ